MPLGTSGIREDDDIVLGLWTLSNLMFHQAARVDVDNVPVSVMTGRLHASGDMGLAMQLQSLFPILGAYFQIYWYRSTSW